MFQGCVGNSVRALPRLRPLLLLLCRQVRLVGVLAAKPGALIATQVLFFPVVFGAGDMGVLTPSAVKR